MRHSTVRLLIFALLLTQCGGFVFAQDFDAAARDSANPKQFLKVYNDTDNLHPNDAGYEAMADAVDQSIFTRLR